MSTTFAAKTQDPSVRQMIEDYLASGGAVRRVPATDSRILPRKHHLDWESITPQADAATVYRAARETKPRAVAAYENWPPLESLVTEVGSCPSAAGSSRAQRFEILEVGVTLSQLRDRGLRLADLTRYLGSGVVKISTPGDDSGNSQEKLDAD